MKDLLKNKIAVVTGAARGIGESIAIEFAKQGAAVALLDKDIDQAKSVLCKIEKYGVKGIALEFDVTNFPNIANTINSIIKELGTIDVWVNNAGIAQNVSFKDMTEQDWDIMLDINLKGMVFCSKAILQKMIERKSGKIINMASLAGQRGGRYAGVNYSASKGGVIAATKVFALNTAEHNIQVNAIAPGLIDTQLSRKLGFNNSTSDIPMGRLGSTEDVAKVALFLASELSDYVTGQTISVNGGMYMT